MLVRRKVKGVDCMALCVCVYMYLASIWIPRVSKVGPVIYDVVSEHKFILGVVEAT